MGSFDIQGPDLTTAHPPVRRHSFNALENAAAALATLQQPEIMQPSSLPDGRPARSRKTSLMVAAQLPSGLKLCSSCREVKAHGLYHACKAKRDGLQDRCKACRAELDKHRLQQARFNSAATAAGSSSVARPRIVGLTRSGSTPTSHVSSGSSPKRRSLKSSSGGSGEHDCSLPLSSEAVAAVAAADATVTAAAAAAAMAASRDDRPVKRRRYPQWNLPAETRSEPSSTWQPLPELPTVVPRQRRSGLPAPSRRSSEPCPSKWQSDIAADVSPYLSSVGLGGPHVLSSSRSSYGGPPNPHGHQNGQLLRSVTTSTMEHQTLPPDWAAQLQVWHQQKAMQQAQQAIQAAERVRLQQLQAQHLAAAAAAKQAEQETMKAQHLQQLVAEQQQQQRQLETAAALAQMQCGRRVLVASLLTVADLSTTQLRRSFVASLGAPLFASILGNFRQVLAPQPSSNSHSMCLANSNLSFSVNSSARQLTSSLKPYVPPASQSSNAFELHHRMPKDRRCPDDPTVLPITNVYQPVADVYSQQYALPEKHVYQHDNRQQQQHHHQQQQQQQQYQQYNQKREQQQHRSSRYDSPPLQAVIEQMVHVAPRAVLDALQWQGHNSRMAVHDGIKSLQLR